MACLILAKKHGISVEQARLILGDLSAEHKRKLLGDLRKESKTKALCGIILNVTWASGIPTTAIIFENLPLFILAISSILPVIFLGLLFDPEADSTPSLIYAKFLVLLHRLKKNHDPDYDLSKLL